MLRSAVKASYVTATLYSVLKAFVCMYFRNPMFHKIVQIRLRAEESAQVELI